MFTLKTEINFLIQMLLWYLSLCYDDILLRHVVINSKRLSQLRRVCFDRLDFVIIACSSHCMYLLLHSLKSFNFAILSMKSLKLSDASLRHLNSVQVLKSFLLTVSCFSFTKSSSFQCLQWCTSFIDDSNEKYQLNY